jgi:hypothetical protein
MSPAPLASRPTLEALYPALLALVLSVRGPTSAPRG